MAEVQINAIDNFQETLKRAENIQKTMDKISKDPMKVTVDSAQVDALLEQLEKVSNAKMQMESTKFQLNTKGELEAVTKLKNAYGEMATIKTNMETNTSTVSYTQDYKKMAEAINAANTERQNAIKAVANERIASEQLAVQKANEYQSYMNTVHGIQEFNGRAEESAQAFINNANAAEEATNKVTEFGNRLKSALMNSVVQMGVQLLVSSFRNAAQEMRNVDRELTNIRKVSDHTDPEALNDYIDGLNDRLYDSASKYGIRASELASNIYEFTKAGYDNAEALGELSVKTQLVGDTTGELADKFLLAVDAAWDYGGNIERLSEVLDEADVINNNYATSLEKITEGIPRVSGVASMAGMSVEETMAALGTIQTVTQESGAKTGTALRALILNILGDTTAEIEEGVTWTKDELNSLGDFMRKYAKDAYDAADATGKLVNPMEAIGAVAEAYKNGDVTDSDLYQLVSDLGGKLRSNQLTALIKNFDMYEEMLGRISDGKALGTADAEVGEMLTSWDSKINILSNTWTEFVSHFLNTDAIKGGIDLLTEFISVLDSTGSALLTMAAAFTATKVASGTAAVQILTNCIREYGLLEGAALTARAAIDALTNKMDLLMKNIDEAASKNPLGKLDLVAGVGVLVSGLTYLNSLVNKSAEADVAASRAASTQEEALKKAGDAILTKAGLNERKFKSDQQIINGYMDEYRKMQTELTAAEEEGDEATAMLLRSKVEGMREYAEAYEEALAWTSKSAEEAEAENEELAESTETVAHAYDELASAVGKATDELAAYDEATKTEKGDIFKKYADVYKEMMNDMADGFTGSNEFKEGIKTLLGVDNVAKLMSQGKSWEDIGKSLGSQFWQGVFNAEGNDYGSNLAFEMYDKIQSDDKWKSALKDVISITKDSSGSLSVAVDDFDALADALGKLTGVTPDPEMLAAWMDALGIYNSDIETSAKNIKEMADAYGALDASTKSIDMQKFVQGLAGDGMDATQIWDYVNALLALDETDPDVTVTTNDLQEIQGYIEGAKTEVEETDGTEATVEINEEGADSVKAQIDSVAQKIRELDGKTANVKIKQTTEVGSNASGTDDAVGGATLVNEKGPEIIQYGNKAWIAGGGAPAIENIPAGAMVFDANETKQILSRSGLEGFMGTIGSAAGGTASGIKRYTGKTITYTGSSAKTTSSSSSKSSSSTGSKNQSDAQKKKIDQLKDIVNLRKSELALLEAQDAPVRQQIDKQREIQDAIKKQIDYMVSIKASQEEINKLWTDWYKIESDIAKLQKDMLDDLSKAIDGEKDSLEEERDALIDSLQKQLDALDEEEDAEDKLLTLEEKRLKVQEAQAALANANAERTVRYYNAATGQWEWRANASNVKSAQESLDNAVKDLQDYEKQLALDNTKQNIQDQIDAIEKQYQDAIDAWEDIQKSMEEPAETIAEALQKIADNFTPAMLSDLDKLNQKLAQFGYSLDIAGLSPVKSYTGVYDDGGVLKGLGGIKATSADEMVIPPMLTRKMLSPTATGTFKQRMEELSFMYGATRNLAGGKTYGIGTQNNGDTYQLGGITMTTAQAKSTTVYELARMSKNLRAYNAG